MLQLTDVQVASIAAGGVLLIVLIALSIYASRRRRARELALQARELAVIVEEMRMTGAGMLCAALLVLLIVGTFIAYGAAKTVFQQIEAGVTLIGGCILFGGGIALGRSRTYRVYRSEHREPN